MSCKTITLGNPKVEYVGYKIGDLQIYLWVDWNKRRVISGGCGGTFYAVYYDILLKEFAHWSKRSEINNKKLKAIQIEP